MEGMGDMKTITSRDLAGYNGWVVYGTTWVFGYGMWDWYLVEELWEGGCLCQELRTESRECWRTESEAQLDLDIKILHVVTQKSAALLVV